MRRSVNIPRSVPLEDRYRVNEFTGCWIFLGSIDDEGYGRVRGRMAHRAYYEALVGPVPNGLDLDHLCVRRECVNPQHLEPVSPGENQARAVIYRIPREWRVGACHRGHPYVEGSYSVETGRHKTGNPYQTRVCLICRRERLRLAYAAKKASRGEPEAPRGKSSPSQGSGSPPF